MDSGLKQKYRLSRAMVIIDAALTYWISLLIADSFLANATRAVGISDALTGILASFVSLSGTIKIASLFLSKKTPYKIWTTVLEFAGELMFAFLYVIPVVSMSKTLKTVLFTSLLLLGYISRGIAGPQRQTWQLSLLESNERGVFQANKDIVSLITGMLFSMGAGYVIDTLREAGKEETAFIVIAIAITVIIGLHMTSIILTKEPPIEYKPLGVREMMKKLVRDKTAVKVLLVPVFYYVAVSISNPFLGSYKISELGLDLTYISIISAISAIVRAIILRPMGRIADKKGFAHMLFVCMPVYILAYVMMFSASAATAKYFVLAFYILNSIAQAGISMSISNVMFDYVDPDMRLCAVAVQSAICGLAALFTTLVAAVLFGAIQNAGGLTVFGHTFYAQQVMSVCSIVCLSLLMLYIAKAVNRLKMTR